jgi:hypothetical protein
VINIINNVNIIDNFNVYEHVKYMNSFKDTSCEKNDRNDFFKSNKNSTVSMGSKPFKQGGTKRRNASLKNPNVFNNRISAKDLTKMKSKAQRVLNFEEKRKPSIPKVTDEDLNKKISNTVRNGLNLSGILHPKKKSIISDVSNTIVTSKHRMEGSASEKNVSSFFRAQKCKDLPELILEDKAGIPKVYSRVNSTKSNKSVVLNMKNTPKSPSIPPGLPINPAKTENPFELALINNYKRKKNSMSVNLKNICEENSTISNGGPNGLTKGNLGIEKIFPNKPMASLRSGGYEKDGKITITRKVDKSGKCKNTNPSSVKNSQKSHSKLKEHLKNRSYFVSDLRNRASENFDVPASQAHTGKYKFADANLYLEKIQKEKISANKQNPNKPKLDLSSFL